MLGKELLRRALVRVFTQSGSEAAIRGSFLSAQQRLCSVTVLKVRELFQNPFRHVASLSPFAFSTSLLRTRLKSLSALSLRAVVIGNLRGGSVCLNRFSGLISGVPAVVMKMMDPRSGTA